MSIDIAPLPDGGQKNMDADRRGRIMRCRICDNDEGNESYVVREMMLGTRDSFIYFQCRRCGCLQIDSYPASISNYYPSDYYAFNAVPRKTGRRLKDRLRLARDQYLVFGTGFVGKAYAMLRPASSLGKLAHLGLTAESRVLDVGCGAGAFLHSLRRLGFNDLTGVDAYIPESRTLGKGFRIIKSDLQSFDGRFDLIVLNHSLEHMPDQQVQFRELSRLLAPEGACMVRVPVASSYAWEHFRSHWVQIDPPRHYYLHTEESLTLLGNRAGLALENVVYDSTGFQYYGSELYRRDITLAQAGKLPSPPFTKRELQQFEAEARKLNKLRKGDQAIFYFRKLR